MESTRKLRILTAEQIWAASDIEEREVAVPQWGDGAGVVIRTLSQKQASELRKRAMRRNPLNGQQEMDNDLLEALLFVEGVVEPKFTMADYGRLQDKSMAAISTILKAVMDSSGLTEASLKEATKSTETEPDAANGVSASAGTEDDARGDGWPNER